MTLLSSSTNIVWCCPKVSSLSLFVIRQFNVNNAVRLGIPNSIHLAIIDVILVHSEITPPKVLPGHEKDEKDEDKNGVDDKSLTPPGAYLRIRGAPQMSQTKTYLQ